MSIKRGLGRAFKATIEGKDNVYEGAVEILREEREEMTLQELARELKRRHGFGYSRRALWRKLEKDDRIEVIPGKRNRYRYKEP